MNTIRENIIYLDLSLSTSVSKEKIYVFMERQPTEIIGLRSLSYLGVFVDDVFFKNNSLQLVKF